METEKQRERLGELIKKVPYGVSVGAKFEQRFCEKMADHLIANNVVVLPLKVGDRIYRLDVLNDKIIDWTIARIDIYDEEVVYYDDCFNVFTKEEFGIEGGVFLTLKEAEKALNERMLEEKENENHTMRND